MHRLRFVSSKSLGIRQDLFCLLALALAIISITTQWPSASSTPPVETAVSETTADLSTLTVGRRVETTAARTANRTTPAVKHRRHHLPIMAAIVDLISMIKAIKSSNSRCEAMDGLPFPSTRRPLKFHNSLAARRSASTGRLPVKIHLQRRLSASTRPPRWCPPAGRRPSASPTHTTRST